MSSFGSAGGGGGGAVETKSREPSRENRGAPLSATTRPFGMPAVVAETISVDFASPAALSVEGAFQ